MPDCLEGKKLTYEELIEILASQSAKILQLEKYVVWLNTEISQWSEFQTYLELEIKDGLIRYKVPYKKFDELEQEIKNYITFNESKSDKKSKKDKL